ncbi:MAG: 50S ribosomal protein L35 [Candidatus Colwellbacteria bacterium]|nr:50S ribosomal protein L35 [Candidatus Colwellbacteria bacterium]
MKTKLKTNKSFAKRFKITKTGKVLYHPAGIRHFLAKKTAKQKRRNTGWKKLAGPLARAVKRMLPYH